MKEMKGDEARQLFTHHAFKTTDKPINDFADLIDDALHYAGGLPLALEVVGSNLCGEDRNYWKSALEKYKRIPEEDIQEKLKISYDGLDEFTQNIFLDIACFFKGDEKDYVTKIMDSCDFFPGFGIKKLIDKCLITIDEDYRLGMHDLLEDMGKEIVRQESPKEPGKRSRLWFHKDVREVLEKNKGTEQIEGILIDVPQDDRMLPLGSEVFANTERLRILRIIRGDMIVCGGLNYLSNSLRVLDWPNCSLEFLPSSFHGENLVVLNISRSNIREMGVTLQSEKLTSIYLSYCQYLTKISDLSSCSNLEKLILDGCESLVEVHDSVGFLDKLVELDFGNCSRLKNLPRSFKLRSLELLELDGCASLENFPEIECKMEHLKCVRLKSTVIQELPSSIAYLTGLEYLHLECCESLVRLPINIFQLKRLKEVKVINCLDFVNFGKEVGHNGQSMPCTQENEISSSMELFPLPPSESNLSQTFNFSSNLLKLSLSGSRIVSLPPCIKGFVGLRSLCLINCKQLEEIPQLPQNIEEVCARGCIRLVKVHDSVGFLDKLVELDFENCSRLKNLPRSFKLRSLELLKLQGCTSLENFPEIECEMEHLKRLWLKSTVIQEPSSITYLTGLEYLYLDRCESLVHLPTNIFQLKRLKAIRVTNCPNFVKEVGHNGQSMPCTQENEISSSMELFPLPPPESNFSLTDLELSGSGIISLPPCIQGFVGLARLSLRDCKQLEEILHLPPNIEWLDAGGCGLLERFPHVSTESSFGTPDLKRLTMINLSECNRVEVDVGNHAPDPLLVQERFWEKELSTIIYPGCRIPKWFKYCKETTSYSSSIDIEIDHNASMCGHKIVALVLCFVVGNMMYPVEVEFIAINGQSHQTIEWATTSRDPHRVYLKYIAGNSIDQMLSISYREGNNMRFTFRSKLNEAIFKSAGVHLIYRNDNFIDPIQLSKR